LLLAIIFSLLLLLLFVFLLPSFNPLFNNTGHTALAFKPTNCPTKPINFLTYQNSTLGIEIQYPCNWEKKNEPSADIPNYSVYFSSPESHSEKYADNIRIYYQPAGKHANVDEFTSAHIIYERQKYPDFRLVESNATTLAGNQAHRLVYTYTNSKLHVMVKAMEVYTITGDKVYTIAYYTQPERYYIYLPTIQKMVDSLKITK
jgi:hypothetical protein